MSSTLPRTERTQFARPDGEGVPTFEWTLTGSSISDIVRLITGPFDVLPVVFVPGIMGSNLKTKHEGTPIWRLDTNVIGLPWNLAKSFALKGPGPRQKLLHPDRCQVDEDGAIPKRIGGTVHDAEIYRARGWGSVGEGSYHEFLLWLEKKLNPADGNPARWSDYYYVAQATNGSVPRSGGFMKLLPGIPMRLMGEPWAHAEKVPFVSILSDDLLARSKFRFPVYAAGYNWLASNDAAALALQRRIFQIIQENDKGQYRCEQVVLVTHSMGGLVARACAQLPAMEGRIAGIVHGVMPASGAAVAYRRCKVGMRDEDFRAALVIGSTGQEVIAVFAQAPGALELLPSQNYTAHWLQVQSRDGRVAESWPTEGTNGNDPYSSIYLRRDRWWGLVHEAWLSPKEGQAIDWAIFEDGLLTAQRFHSTLADEYHPNTYTYYGATKNVNSFEKVTWKLVRGFVPGDETSPSIEEVLKMTPRQVRMNGTTPEYVGAHSRLSMEPGVGVGGSHPYLYDMSHWELHCELQDGTGDGTVPLSSGAAPLARGGTNVQQQFKLGGVEHEPSFKDAAAQKATLYAITKIVGKARRPK